MREVNKLLIADDQAMIRAGLTKMLEAQNDFIPLITEASDGNEVLDAIRSQEYDLVLMDIRMPRMDGISTLKKIRSKKISIPILMMSVYHEEQTIKQVIENEGNGFLTKDAGVEELVRSIRTILSGEQYYSNAITQILIGKSLNKKEIVGIESNLTRREWQVLQLIIEELSHDQIGEKLGISPRTVESHKKNLTFKMDVKGSIGLVKMAYRNGLVI